MSIKSTRTRDSLPLGLRNLMIDKNMLLSTDLPFRAQMYIPVPRTGKRMFADVERCGTCAAFSDPALLTASSSVSSDPGVSSSINARLIIGLAVLNRMVIVGSLAAWRSCLAQRKGSDQPHEFSSEIDPEIILESQSDPFAL